MGDRCAICDWQEDGLTNNLDIDQFTLKGTPNRVFWNRPKQKYICHKCHESAELYLREYQDFGEEKYYGAFKDWYRNLKPEEQKEFEDLNPVYGSI